MQFPLHTILLLAMLPLFLVLLMVMKALLPFLERRHATTRNVSAKQNKGAPRSIFPILYLLFAWACFVFFVPMAMGFRDLHQTLVAEQASVANLFRILISPIVFLLIVFYGIKRGFLNWIMDRKWPYEVGEQEGTDDW